MRKTVYDLKSDVAPHEFVLHSEHVEKKGIVQRFF